MCVCVCVSVCVRACVRACVSACVSVGGGVGDSVGEMELRVGSNTILLFLYIAASHMAHVLFWCVYIIHC